MMSKNKTIIAMAAFATCMVLGSSAFADNWHGNNDNNGRGNNGRNNWHNSRNYDYRGDSHFNGDTRVVYRRPPVVVIRPQDRVVIHDYYTNYRPVRPIYQNSWRSGYYLPQYVTYQRISPRLLNRLQPIPVGYEYVQVDNNILLISDATRLVVDALTL